MSAPALEGEEGLFPILLAGLEQFGERLSAYENGHWHHAKTALGVVADVLTWLEGVIAAIDDYVLHLDVLAATLETIVASLASLGPLLEQLTDELDVPLLDQAASALVPLTQSLADTPELLDIQIIPDPGALIAIQTLIPELLASIEQKTQANQEAEP